MILRSCADNCSNFVSGFSNKRWRRNGKTRYWKRTPERFHLPVKHGMYAYDYINQDTEGVWCAEHGDALAAKLLADQDKPPTV